MDVPTVPHSLMMLSYALALGLLIGLERGWTSREEAAGTRVAGFRTFGVLGLIGGVAGMLAPPLGATALLLSGGVLLVGYLRQSKRANGLSATNALASLLTLILGMLATSGRPTEALAAAAAVTLLLAMRETLHGLLRGMSEAEIRSAARFGLITFVILPLAPDRQMGPLDAWNPHQLWLVVVLVSGLSFAGYVATRRIDPMRSALVTAVCGAIVSSTAVTVAFARRLRSGDEPAGPLTGGIALASVVMFLRVLLLTALLAPFALPTLALIVVPALAVATILAAILMRRPGAVRPTDDVKLGNPLDLSAALGLAFLVALMTLASRWAFGHFGGIGIAGVLAITGLADVDAAILALAGLPAGTLDGRMAGLVLAGPVLLNTVFKAVLAIAFAPGKAGLRAAAPLMASVVAAGLAALLLV
jgi:uncharacterized membrane protein (DUF4010 family)